MVHFLPKILGDAQETALWMGTVFKAVEIQRAVKQWGNLPLTCPRYQQSQHMWPGAINFVERTTEMRSLGKDSPILSLSSKPWIILRKASEWSWCLPLRLGMECWTNGEMRWQQPTCMGDPTGIPVWDLGINVELCCWAPRRWRSLPPTTCRSNVLSDHRCEADNRTRHGWEKAYFWAMEHFLFSINLGNSGPGIPDWGQRNFCM